jgi:hypothetical protein
MTSAFESTPQHDLAFAAERLPQRDLAFAPAMTAKIASALGRLLPASMIALGAVASLGWAVLLLWLLFQIVVAIV